MGDRCRENKKPSPVTPGVIDRCIQAHLHSTTVQFYLFLLQFINCSTAVIVNFVKYFGGKYCILLPLYAGLPWISALEVWNYMQRIGKASPNLSQFYIWIMFLNSHLVCPCLFTPWATVATANKCLLNSEVKCWKDVGHSQLLWQAPQSPSYCILLKHQRDKLRSFQCVLPSAVGYTISPDVAFILESFIEYLKLPWQGQNLTCLSSLQLLLCSQTGLV